MGPNALEKVGNSIEEYLLKMRDIFTLWVGLGSFILNIFLQQLLQYIIYKRNKNAEITEIDKEQYSNGHEDLGKEKILVKVCILGCNLYHGDYS